MIEDLIIKQTKKDFYQIYIKDNDTSFDVSEGMQELQPLAETERGNESSYKYKLLELQVNNCYLPFGIEEYNNKYLINFEVDISSEFHKLIRKLESKLNELVEIVDCPLELKSVFHKKPKYKLLCKAYIKKTNNTFISKYLLNNKETSIFDLEKGKKYNLELVISGIWIFKNTIGIYIHLKKISISN